MQRLFGIELPIVQAPMAGSQASALAAAVSNAGGLGSVPAALCSPDELKRELRLFREATSRPVNLNFFCHVPPQFDQERDRAWRLALAAYYREFGLTQDLIPDSAGRAPFSDESADIVDEFRPEVVSFHFGLPTAQLVERVRATGATIMSSATTVDEARWLEARGVDAIIAQGLEAGGHRGMFLSDDVRTQVGTFALVRQIVQAVNIPVIAAGGIADAAGVAAAIALGAQAVEIGTAYLLCPEAATSAVHRAALTTAAARETAVTNVFTGRPARGIVNRFMNEVGPMNAAVPPFPLAAPAVLPLRRHAEATGSGQFSSLWAGQNVTGCKEMPAGELTRELAAGIVR